MKLFAIALLAGLTTPVIAAEEFCNSGKPHPIDIESDARAQKAMTTVDMREAQGSEYQAWDAEMNRIYKVLLAKLGKDDAAKFRAAQRAWTAFRDRETDWLWSKSMYGDSGTAGPINVSGAGTRMVRERVCQLTQALQARESMGND